jgi:hypothetical protein
MNGIRTLLQIAVLNSEKNRLKFLNGTNANVVMGSGYTLQAKNRSCLLSFEIPFNIQKVYSIDLFPKHENHWSTRAIKKRQTAFNNDEELKDFICSANNATFGIFNVHLQSQQKDSKSTYFLFVSPIHTPAP